MHGENLRKLLSLKGNGADRTVPSGRQCGSVLLYRHDWSVTGVMERTTWIIRSVLGHQRHAKGVRIHTYIRLVDIYIMIL